MSKYRCDRKCVLKKEGYCTIDLHRDEGDCEKRIIRKRKVPTGKDA